jgi:predicted transcriptional regulator
VEMEADVLSALKSIDRRLALLTGPQERDLRRTLIADLLKTPARVKMFDGIDGSRGTADLAKLADVSDRAVQQFVKELTELGLVQPADGGGRRGVVVARDEDAIVQWYLQRTRDAGT